MKKTIFDRPGPSKTTVILIQDSNNEIVGKIIAAHPTDGAGTLYLTLWDWTDDENPRTTEGRASGFGFDKISHILGRLTFGGVNIEEGKWEKSLQDAGFKIFKAL